MPAYNRVILCGNLTRDPEMRYIANGNGVVKFNLAINRKTKNGDEVTYVDIIAWEKLAETCNTYLKKGDPVLVEGRLVIRSYDDKDGNKRKATEIVIDAMQMLGTRRDREGGNGGNANGGGSGGYTSGGGNQYRGNSGNGGSYDEAELENEIPF